GGTPWLRGGRPSPRDAFRRPASKAGSWPGSPSIPHLDGCHGPRDRLAARPGRGVRSVLGWASPGRPRDRPGCRRGPRLGEHRTSCGRRVGVRGGAVVDRIGATGGRHGDATVLRTHRGTPNGGRVRFGIVSESAASGARRGPRTSFAGGPSMGSPVLKADRNGL